MREYLLSCRHNGVNGGQLISLIRQLQMRTLLRTSANIFAEVRNYIVPGIRPGSRSFDS